MAKRHILMADTQGLADYVKPALAKINDGLELVAVADGARCITAHAKLCRAKAPPLVVIVPEVLEYVSGAQVARTLRTVERSLGVVSAAIIYVTDRESAAQQTRDWGRAVVMKKAGAEDDQQSEFIRLVRAIAKVLSQLSKRGRK
jgi:DNA-binding LytR/AlgR family response regulator